jgi:hypothetical protein
MLTIMGGVLAFKAMEEFRGTNANHLTRRNATKGRVNAPRDACDR